MNKNETMFFAFSAYQHFLFYIDVNDLREKNIWGEHMTNHFMDKLTGIIKRSGDGYCSVESVVRWIQEMSPMYQKILLTYIIENHSNKW